MTLKENSMTAVGGKKAAAFGRELPVRSNDGRPLLDRSGRPGQHSRATVAVSGRRQRAVDHTRLPPKPLASTRSCQLRKFLS